MDINVLISHLSNCNIKVVTVNKYKIEPGKSGKQKTSKYPGIIFPISGSAEFKMYGRPYLVTEGTIFHGSADTEIFKRVIGNQPWEYILILYEVFNEPSNMRMSEKNFLLKIGKSQIITDLLEKSWINFKNPDNLSKFHVDTIFRRILEETFFRCKNDNINDQEAIYNKIIDYIQCNYMNIITVNHLAEIGEISESKLFYIFKKYAGINVREYIIKYRMNIASELLKTTDLQINEISQRVGYEDPLYFSRIFKKKLGSSPINYRNE